MSCSRLWQEAATGKRADADKFGAGWIKDQPKDVGFASYLADITLARNDLPAAEVLYRRVIELQPDNAVALNNVAWLMVKANKPGAVAMAEQANAFAVDHGARVIHFTPTSASWCGTTAS